MILPSHLVWNNLKVLSLQDIQEQLVWGKIFKYPSDFDNEVSSGIWSIQSRSLHLSVKGPGPELDVFFKEASLRCRGRAPEQLAMALGGRTESLGLLNAWGSALVSALISHLPGWDLPGRNFMTEVWDGVIGTSLNPKEVGLLVG